MCETIEPDMRDHLIRAHRPFALCGTGELKRKCDIILHGAPGKQIVLLSHIADVGVDVRHARSLVDD
jgi:hypothetical protein